MTITEIFDMFLAGKQLPSLASNQARSLLDLARSKLLSRGVRPPAPGSDIKADLLTAHRLLTGQGGIYASTAGSKNPLADLTGDQIDAMLAEHKATGKPLLQLFAEQQGGTVKATTKPATRTAAPVKAASPAPAPAPAPSATRPLTVPSARQIAAAILDEQEARRIASLTKTRAQLAAMTAREVGAFFKNGGKLTD